MAKKPTKTGPDLWEYLDKNNVSLPSIPSDLRIKVRGGNPDFQREFYLLPQTLTTVTNVRTENLSSDEKDSLFLQIQRETRKVLDHVCNEVSKFAGADISEGCMAILNDYQTWSEKVLQWAKQSMFGQSIDTDTFYELWREHSNLQRRRILAGTINSKYLEKTVAELEEKLSNIKSQRSAGTGQKNPSKPNIKTWDELTIEFIDDGTIKYKGADRQWHRVNYAELGFQDRRNGLPNQLWGILRTLAEQNTLIAKGLPTSKHSLPMDTQKSIDRIRKTLRAYFDLQDIPIVYNRTKHRYCCKFTLREAQEDLELYAKRKHAREATSYKPDLDA
ncbi:MAG: hypothetical protein FVQ82_02550 [Planctomycetes bacterium]|nr:hypothetical protein [Planctomycetota bacterium]